MGEGSRRGRPDPTRLPLRDASQKPLISTWKPSGLAIFPGIDRQGDVAPKGLPCTEPGLQPLANRGKQPKSRFRCACRGVLIKYKKPLAIV